MLGAVGAFDWNGTVVMQQDGVSVQPPRTTFHNPLEERYEGLAGYVGEYCTVGHSDLVDL